MKQNKHKTDWKRKKRIVYYTHSRVGLEPRQALNRLFCPFRQIFAWSTSTVLQASLTLILQILRRLNLMRFKSRSANQKACHNSLNLA